MLKQKSKGLKSNHPSLYLIEFGGLLKTAPWPSAASVRVLTTTTQKILF